MATKKKKEGRLSKQGRANAGLDGDLGLGPKTRRKVQSLKKTTGAGLGPTGRSGNRGAKTRAGKLAAKAGVGKQMVRAAERNYNSAKGGAAKAASNTTSRAKSLASSARSAASSAKERARASATAAGAGVSKAVSGARSAASVAKSRASSAAKSARKAVRAKMNRASKQARVMKPRARRLYAVSKAKTKSEARRVYRKVAKPRAKRLYNVNKAKVSSALRSVNRSTKRTMNSVASKARNAAGAAGNFTSKQKAAALQNLRKAWAAVRGKKRSGRATPNSGPR